MSVLLQIYPILWLVSYYKRIPSFVNAFKKNEYVGQMTHTSLYYTVALYLSSFTIMLHHVTSCCTFNAVTVVSLFFLTHRVITQHLMNI